jgi:hypothetical protein
VLVDPLKPILKAPKTKRLKLKYDEPPSEFAFNFNLRRYTMGPAAYLARGGAVLNDAYPANLRI